VARALAGVAAGVAGVAAVAELGVLPTPAAVADDRRPRAGRAHGQEATAASASVIMVTVSGTAPVIAADNTGNGAAVHGASSAWQ
jgi:hypothetical protein